MDHIRRIRRAALVAATIVVPVALTAPASAEDTFKLGVVTFLSGPAAESFGVPARNGGQFVVEELNKGAAPTPYDKVGFGGMKIEPVVIDENGGATKQVQELRNLYERDKVDVVLGYIGSGDCLAVAPIAEELKKMLILMDCGTPRIFEEAKYNYVFRTAAHATMDNVGLIRYMKAKGVKMTTLSAINQDYAWGQDSRADFLAAAGQLYPDAKLQADLFPKFGAGQYGTEISALVSAGSDVVYSSLWGGDLQAFILQATPRGLPKRSQLVLSAADHVLPPLSDKMPDGTIIGARGAYGLMSQKSPINDWFFKGYQNANGIYPVQAAYRIAQSILGLKTAVEKAMAKNGGKKPSTDELIAAMTGLEWQSPGGLIQMKLADGHQAIQPIAFSRTKYNPDLKRVDLVDIQYFPAECVNPPAGVKSIDWIKGGMQGAKCN
ncbi:ABC transporter substrate-binding protein [Bradyrhizobium sp. NP1]|uniref:ABC transporter substrate-binding protein n=1 Tax=Bradyrhizobium sp. NP1 TaxID=3049772 RepID=UPI0025A4FFA6|nr:ABC transporter substrate-binding protein [Bradyrhizobium sp. NP1]WJR76406.1 ABC transporter substrate-binding protein [Bradyrhizobium sp. NP1]